MYFRNYRPRKTCLDKCLKAPIWEDPSTGEMVNGPKHWFSLGASAFTILIVQCEDNWVRKSFSEWHAKSWDFSAYTLTADDNYSLFSRDNSKQTIQMDLSWKQNIFCHFFFVFPFFNSTLNLEDFQKKMTLIAYVFPKLPTPKDVLR